MSDPIRQPVAEVIANAATTALPADDPIDPGYFVPQATRENYLGIVRDQATVRDVDPDVVRGELVEQFRTMHSRQPLDGYDHLAGWLDGADLSALYGPTGRQVLVARMLESARRDPQQAVVGDQALVEVGIAAQTAADEAALAAASAPAVDPSSGALPSGGPLPVPEGVTAADPAVVEQQQAAAAQLEGQGDGTPSSTPPASSGGDTSSSSSSSGGDSSTTSSSSKSSKSSDSSSS